MNCSDRPDPETGIFAYLQCGFCLNELPENTNPMEYARLSIGASPTGDLIVWCNRHGTAVTVMQNDKIAVEFFKISASPCDCCGRTEVSH